MRDFIVIRMIVEFFLIPLLFVTFAGWGAWFKLMTGNKTELFSLTIIMGLVLFSIWTSLLSFFTPLSLTVELVLLVISLIPFFSKKLRIYMGKFPKEIFRSVWFYVFLTVIIFAGSFYPFRPDYFDYYNPSLNWLNQYGLITGIANIDWNLGQMSVFHIMQAGLDQTIDPYQRLAVFITILFLVYIFERKTYLLLFAIPFYFLFIQAPSPDVIIVFLSLVVVNEICFHHRLDNYKVLFFIACFLFIIKPVAFWLPLWVFIAGFFLNRQALKDYRIYLIPTLLLVIFMVKNVIASSTLLYPVSLTKLNTYWLPDLRILEISDQLASSLTFYNNFTNEEIEAMTFWNKIYFWLSIKELQTIINYFILIALLAFGIFSFFKKNILYQLLWITVVIKTILVFNFSGQFRFILDSVLPLIFILFYSVKRIGKTSIFVACLASSLLILTAISYPPFLKQTIPSFKLTQWMNGFNKKTLLFPGNYKIKKYAEQNIGNLDFNISYYYHNYGTPLPAFQYKELKLYFDLGAFPQMKDPTNIRKGFYSKKLTPEEKEKLGEILEAYFPHLRD